MSRSSGQRLSGEISGADVSREAETSWHLGHDQATFRWVVGGGFVVLTFVPLVRGIVAGQESLAASVAEMALLTLILAPVVAAEMRAVSIPFRTPMNADDEMAATRRITGER